MRKKETPPDFAAQTLQKYIGLAKHVRRTFEAKRDENKLIIDLSIIQAM